MSTDYFAAAWARTHSAEGGYSNNPADPGGATNHGVTEAVARRFGYVGDMRDLPLEVATAIAKRAYWDPLRLDSVAAISPEVAAELFDTNFNLWWPAAGLFLQRSLNALNRQGKDYADQPEDGQIGAGTLSALASFIAVRGKVTGTRVLVALLNAQQACDYLRQCGANPAKEEFLFGWLVNRVVTPAE